MGKYKKVQPKQHPNTESHSYLQKLSKMSLNTEHKQSTGFPQKESKETPTNPSKNALQGRPHMGTSPKRASMSTYATKKLPQRRQSQNAVSKDISHGRQSVSQKPPSTSSLQKRLSYDQKSVSSKAPPTGSPKKRPSYDQQSVSSKAPPTGSPKKRPSYDQQSVSSKAPPTGSPKKRPSYDPQSISSNAPHTISPKKRPSHDVHSVSSKAPPTGLPTKRLSQDLQPISTKAQPTGSTKKRPSKDLQSTKPAGKPIKRPSKEGAKAQHSSIKAHQQIEKGSEPMLQPNDVPFIKSTETLRDKLIHKLSVSDADVDNLFHHMKLPQTHLQSMKEESSKHTRATNNQLSEKSRKKLPSMPSSEQKSMRDTFTTKMVRINHVQLVRHGVHQGGTLIQCVKHLMIQNL